jgi:hypothetical protein
MFLKNYTSNVPVSETIHNIEKVLIRCGVSGIEKQYGPEMAVIAVVFHIHPDPKAPRFTIRLPVDKERALEALWADYIGDDKVEPDGKGDFRFASWQCKKRKKRADFAQQAERTAWKIIQDWVEVQMSMIQTRQADFVEVFMPYLYDGKQSLYQRAISAGGVGSLLLENSK